MSAARDRLDAALDEADGPPWNVEHKHKWVLTEDPPEGWRHCFNQFNGDCTELVGLYTDAPKNEPPHRHNVRWIPFERIEWERLVTPWIRQRRSSDTEVPE